jgi:hypothetical protein
MMIPPEQHHPEKPVMLLILQELLIQQRLKQLRMMNKMNLQRLLPMMKA